MVPQAAEESSKNMFGAAAWVAGCDFDHKGL